MATTLQIFNRGTYIQIIKNHSDKPAEHIEFEKDDLIVEKDFAGVIVLKNDLIYEVIDWTRVTTPTSTSSDDLLTKLREYLYKTMMGETSDGLFKNIKVTDTGSISTTVEGVERLDSGFSFVSTISRLSTAAPEDVVLFRNPAASVKNAKFSNFELYFNSANFITWEVYRNPTITSQGTALAAINANGASSEIAKSTLYDAPTISSPGTRLIVFCLDINGRSNKNPFQIVLAPGQDALLRRTNIGVNNDLRLTFQWTEEEI